MYVGAAAARPRSTFGRGPSSGFGGGGHLHSGSRSIGARPASRSGIGAPLWPKDAKQRGYAGVSDGGGLRRQASAPTLAAPSQGAGGYDHRGHSQAGSNDSTPLPLRRTSSATSVGFRGPAPGRPARPASGQKRYPSSSLNASADMMGSSFHGSFQAPHRADAWQLESRLTERLRDYQMASPGMRQAQYGHAHGHRPSRGGYYPQARLNASDSYALPPRPPPDPWGVPPSASAHPSPDVRMLHARGHAPLYDSFMDHGAMGASGGFDHSSMSMSRLKIYSDLFEEVIERDRVFGSLLRKIKTAYENVLGQEVPMLPHGPQQQMSRQSAGAESVPDLPEGPYGPDLASATGPSSSYDGQHSNEPTTRAEDGPQAREMIRENRVLKDLVERLHLELEEAVKREHRWKQKVVKLKGTQPGHTELVRDDAEEMARLEQPSAWTKKFHASRREPGMQGGKLQEDKDELYKFHAMHGSVHDSPYMDGAEAILNQGGILSMSSISPQNSAPPHPESMLGASQLESARSTDSVPLPQKPDRKRVVRPNHVPCLDFARLAQALEEEEEMAEEEGEDMIPEDEGVAHSTHPHPCHEELMYAHHHGQQARVEDDRSSDGEDGEGEYYLRQLQREVLAGRGAPPHQLAEMYGDDESDGEGGEY